VDRVRRIHQLIAARERFSVADVARMQSDVNLVAAQELVPLVLDAHAFGPASDATTRAALALFHDWDMEMRRDRAAPALFALFHRRLYEAVFEDELGPELTKAFRSRANLWAIALRAALSGHAQPWLDRVDTPEVEDRRAIVRRAFATAVRDLVARFGDYPRSARWGALHTLTFRHSLGRGSRLAGLYFDRGPFPVDGHTGTVNKMEYPFDDFAVTAGPSMRQVADLADLDRSLAALPGGQSGLPASPHYDDLLQLWLRGEHHPFPMGRPAVERIAAARLVLEP
jgi:penicillin amidase